VEILQQGGSAADAALATALAQVPLLPGNFISYAGIMELLYYDAASGEIYSLNAGWDVPEGEGDPLSIPATEFPFNGKANPSGRTALVPGFMAGLEAAHRRFGVLPFAALFEPAIAFARQGVVLDALQGNFIAEFEPVITRLPETAALYTREDGQLYQTGDRFRQPALADTLEEVARAGAAYMYTGAWGQKFAETIQREGGTITREDLSSYEPLWTEPVSTRYAGYDITSAGQPGFGGVNLIEAFNLLEAAGLDAYGHFAEDPESLFWMMQISRAGLLTSLDSQQQASLFPGQDRSPTARLAKESAARFWPQIQAGRLPFFVPIQGTANSHSAAVVAVDNQGNIAALTHTSNAYLYGGSGIAVDGVYIPDPGSYQQYLIQRTGAGNRLPNPINPVIVLHQGQPVWASSCIGNVHGETFQRLASMLAFGLDLQQAQRAPTILASRFEDGSPLPTGQFFRGEFDRQLLEAVQKLGQPLVEISVDFDTLALNRGVLAAITIDPGEGTLTGAVPAVLGGFAEGY
jgi:gamma-glutamyltranspeptidase/glutathione hydrolase